MWRATLKGVLAHKLRLALTGSAIVLGVMFVSGTLVLTDTLHATFNNLFQNIYQNTSFVVRGHAAFTGNIGAVRNPIPESVAGEVRAVPGVAAANGTASGIAQFVAPDGKAISTGGAPTVGTSFEPNSTLSPLHLRQGSAPITDHQLEQHHSDGGTDDSHNRGSHCTAGDGHHPGQDPLRLGNRP